MYSRVFFVSKGPASSSAVSRKASRGMLSMAKKDEEVDRQISNMARAARKVGPNDRVVELRKVNMHCLYVCASRCWCL